MTVHHQPITITITALLSMSLTLSACTGETTGDAGSDTDATSATTSNTTPATTDDPTGESTGESAGDTDTTETTGDNTSETTGDNTTGDTGELFPGCERSVLADDLVVIDTMGMPGPIRWYGPGAHPETGELLDDGVSTYHVSTTYLARKPTDEAIGVFFDVIGDVNQALFSNPGMVAAQLTESTKCNAARTFTVWKDEAAMMEFVTSDAHIAAIGEVATISRGGSAVISWADVPAADIDWESALAELGAIEPAY